MLSEGSKHDTNLSPPFINASNDEVSPKLDISVGGSKWKDFSQ
jgi:hypothetical protein